MAVIETWYTQDLQKPVKTKYLDGNMFSHNGNGNRIGVELYNNGEPLESITGTVSGYVVVSDGTTVPCVGDKGNNRAWILIPVAAYQPGNVFISIFLTDGTTVTTLAAVQTTVLQTRTGTQVDPGSVVADWTQTINAAMQEVETAADNVAGMVADYYSALTFPVPLGKYCIYNYNLYRCISPIATSENWTASHWTQVKLADDVSDLKSALTSSESMLSAFADRQYIDGSFSITRGLFSHRIYNPINDTYSSRDYRIATTEPIKYPYPVKLVCNTGFRIYLYRYNGSAWTGSWVTTNATIPQGEAFYMQIARVTEDTSEIADIAEFLAGVTIERSTADRVLLKYVGDGITDDGAILSAQIATLYDRGYRNFSINACGTATIKTPLVIPSNTTLDGNGVTLNSANLATAEGVITPSRIISMTSLANINIRNIRFTGSRTNGSAPTAGNCDNLIYLFNCANISFENCLIINYDTSKPSDLAPDSGYDEYPHSRAERISAFVACGTTNLNIINMKIRNSNRELITLSRCSDFVIELLKTYDNGQYDVPEGQEDVDENRSYRAYSVLNLFDCNRGKLDKLYIIHVSHTSAINYFTQNTTLTNSYIYGEHLNTTGIDMGNEIEVDHYLQNNIIANNIIRCPIRRVGVVRNGDKVHGYGFSKLMFIGNIIDLSHYDASGEYSISVPCGEVYFYGNYIRGGLDVTENKGANGFQIGNSWGRKVFIGNYILAPIAFNCIPRKGKADDEEPTALPGDKTELIIKNNVVSHLMASVNFPTQQVEGQTMLVIDDETRLKIFADGNTSLNGGMIRVGSIPTAENDDDFTEDTLQVRISGGKSSAKSIIGAGINIKINGHECTSNDYLLESYATIENLLISHSTCENATLVHVRNRESVYGNLSGNICFCCANKIVEVDEGCTDNLNTDHYNVELNVD